MSVDVAEASQPVSSAETDDCVGDGTTCVECGKVFTHPFYFSTHISTHTSEKEFVVVGQCALCGLVFSDPVIFSAHINSSQKRLDTQVMPDVDENEEERPTKKVLKGKAARLGQVESNGVPEPNEVTIKEEIMDDMQPSSNDPVVDPNENASGINGDSKNKRKRRAPQRFEIEHTSPPVSSSDVDPAVEAYLLSLKQMGLTVDPEAFSSPKGSKRIRRSSEGGRGRGRGRGRKMMGFTIDPMEMDIKTEGSPTKKASPKYEYDSDSSFDENEMEILPQSGKMTRGQRLQQRLERLSQAKEDNNQKVKTGITRKKPEAENDSNGASDQTEQSENGSQAGVPVTKSPGLQVTGASKIKKPEKTGLVAQRRTGGQTSTPVKPTPLGEILGAGSLLAQNISRFHSPRPRAAGNYGQVTPVILSPNSGPVFTPRGPAINNIRQRGLGTPPVRGRGSRGGRGGMLRTPGPQDLLLNNSLEDLKRNSRDNVQHMLQNVGMMAVTSSLEQGKQTATRGGPSPLPRGRGARGLNQARFRQNSQFNSPQSMTPGVVSHDVPNRFNAPTAGVVNRYPRGRGRQATNSVAASSTPLPGGCSTHPGSCGNGRGHHHHHHHHHHHSGQGTSGQPVSGPAAANRGMRRPCPIHGYRRLLNSNEVIVIDDDDVVEVQPTEVINADDDDVQEIKADSSNGKSALDPSELSQSDTLSDGKEGTIMNIDLEGEVSKTKGSGDIDMADDGLNETSCDTLEQDSEAADHMTEHQVGRRKRRKMDFPVRIVDKRRDSEENQDKKRTDDTEVSPGEDIDGWKVCLADNSDSNEGNLSQPSTPAAASDRQELTTLSEQDAAVSSPPVVEKSANDNSTLQNSATSSQSKPSKVKTDAVQNKVESELQRNVTSLLEESLERTDDSQSEDACLGINQTNTNTETEERSPIASDDEAESRQFQDVEIPESLVSSERDSSDEKNITDKRVDKPSSDMGKIINQEKSETVSQSGLFTNSDLAEPCSAGRDLAAERLENSATAKISHPEPGMPTSHLSVGNHGNPPDQVERVNHEVNSFQLTDASQRSPGLVTEGRSCDPTQTVSHCTATVQDNVQVPALDNCAETTSHIEEDKVVQTSVDSHVSSNDLTDCNEPGDSPNQEHLFSCTSKSLDEMASRNGATEGREPAGVCTVDDLVSQNQSDNSGDITFHVGTFLQEPSDSQQHDTGLAESTAGKTDSETFGCVGSRVSSDQTKVVTSSSPPEGQVLSWNSSTLVQASEKLDAATSSSSSDCLTQCNDSVVDVFSEIQKACQQIEDLSSEQVGHSSGDHQIENLSSVQVVHGCGDGKASDNSHLQVLGQDGTESQVDSEELTGKEDVLSETQGSSIGSENTEVAAHT